MKHLIEYLYKVEVDRVVSYKNNYIIKTSNKFLYLFQVDNKVRINYMIDVISNINMSSFFCYRFLKNIYNDYYFLYDGKEYIIVELERDYNSSIDIDEMISFYESSSFLNKNLNFKLNWDILWENKIDYLHLHINNNILNNNGKCAYFYYYIGVAENTLLYVKNLKNTEQLSYRDKLVFCHRRVKYPCKKIDFFNPTDFNIDLEVRDIAEYIKSQFYENEEYLIDLEYYLKVRKLTEFSASLLYARLIFPSIFFDYYEFSEKCEVLYEKFDINKFEMFAKKTYELINSYVEIDKIPWL